TITIVNPTPVITSLDPSSAQPLAQVTIHGQGFLSTSTVALNGQTVTSAFADSSTMSFIIPAAATPGAASVVVINPGPGGGSSNAAALTVINPVPSVSSVSPAAALGGMAVPLLVTGSNFVQGSVINFAGGALSTT